MSEQSGEVPFKSLGVQLKVLRQKFQESVADVAGAVEIDESELQRIELGTARPSEDILMLLISHFGIHEDEATNLWLLAGYDKPDEKTDLLEEANGRPVVVMMTLDTRILYSDQAHISANKRGVVLDFMQNAPTSSGKAQQVPIARIGMSYEQATDLLKVLHQTLAKANELRQPKGLPAPKTDSRSKPKKSDTN